MTLDLEILHFRGFSTRNPPVSRILDRRLSKKIKDFKHATLHFLFLEFENSSILVDIQMKYLELKFVHGQTFLGCFASRNP